MAEITTTDTVTVTDSATVETVTRSTATITTTDTVTLTDSTTVETVTRSTATITTTDTVTLTDSTTVETVTRSTATITTHDYLRFYETTTIERIRDDRVVESRTITYPERVTVMNLDLLLDALALTVRELGAKMGENARDIGTVFLAGTFGVETIKITKDIKLMLRKTIEDMIRAMKG